MQSATFISVFIAAMTLSVSPLAQVSDVSMLAEVSGMKKDGSRLDVEREERQKKSPAVSRNHSL